MGREAAAVETAAGVAIAGGDREPLTPALDRLLAAIRDA
jgi:hypothetical protein